MSSTIDYYNENAQVFSDNTKDIEFTAIQNHFLSLIQPKALILDFGCGSGRDTKYFLDKDYNVEAIDGSEELCRLASEYTGITVRHMLFNQLHELEKYDAIWACSSILHLDIDSLFDVFGKMVAALKPYGIIYTSFKYGTFSGDRNGRYFTDMTEASVEELVGKTDSLTIEDQWITSDARSGREDEKWLNLIMRKTNNCQ